MSRRAWIFPFLLLALTGRAQQPAGPSPLTEKLLLAQKPEGITVEQWSELIRKPATASLYPIRLTQAMLDTLDVKQLDIRYQYVMLKEEEPAPLVPKAGR